MASEPANLPEGIFSLLDTDLYKLTMQCCILKFFPHVSVTYGFTNRTPDKKLNRAAFKWLQAQVDSTIHEYFHTTIINAFRTRECSRV
jgi:nicotinate phosphoribosyltransferase